MPGGVRIAATGAKPQRQSPLVARSADLCRLDTEALCQLVEIVCELADIG